MRTAVFSWQVKLMLLVVLSIPAFSGYPLGRLPLGAVVPGISWSWTSYWLLVQAVVGLLTGKRLYARVVAASALVTLPVVFGGAAISWLGLQLGVGGGSAAAAGVHYTRLCMTMLTVVPLALTFLVLLPLDMFERRLLLRTRGLAPWQKKALMAMRVFNHIAYGVIPAMLEVLREEQLFGRRVGRDDDGGFRIGYVEAARTLSGDLVQLAVEGICASLQFIPLWAYEIARLSDRRRRHEQ